MNLLDMFRKSKKSQTPTASLGKLWVCAVKFSPWDDDQYGAEIAETDIKEAYVRNGEPQVESFMKNPFNKCDPITLRGPVGHLEYVSQSGQWIGFFETKKDAEAAYRQFAANLMQKIESASAKLGLSGETKQA